MSANQKQVWLVTGASQGLGLAVALAALKAGHHVIGTARQLGKAEQEHPEFAIAGGTWLQLDVVDDLANVVVTTAIEEAGRIDVLVNNAAMVMVGTMEDLSMEEMQTSFRTNFFGSYRVAKAVIERMRGQGSGTIVNVGSIYSVVGLPMVGAYTCSKFAMEGMSETLALELDPFGIRVLQIEAGYFRTEIFRSSQMCAAAISPHYLETRLADLGGRVQKVTMDPSCQPGDPVKYGKAVVDVVDGKSPAGKWKSYLWLPLGKDAVQIMERKVQRLTQNLDMMKQLALSTDFDDFDDSKRMFPLEKDIL